MNSYREENVINGSWGEFWIDNDYMAEVTSAQAKMKLEMAEVKMTRTLKKGQKVVGIDGEGTVKFNKVSSYMVKKVLDNIRAGKATRGTMITKLDDPEALGAEKIQLNDCVITELTLADWEAGKNLEEEIPFKFGDAELLEAIEE